MCERCVAAQERFEVHREKIEQAISEARDTLIGVYTDDVKKMVAGDPFPEDKPFMEMLFRLSSAAMRLATAQAIIEGQIPSEILADYAMVARQGEREEGILAGVGGHVIAIPMSEAQDFLSALFGAMGDDDEGKTILH